MNKYYEYAKKWRNENKEKCLEYNRNRRKKGIRYPSDSPENKRIRSAVYRKRHPEIIKHKSRIDYLKRKNITGSFSVIEWNNLIQKQNYTCNICKRVEPEIKLTVDHIIPISRGGDGYINNIQGLCRSCNSRKKNHIPE